MSIYFAFAENTNLLLNLKPALVYSKDSDSQSSTTKSGINTQNIIIKDEAEQLKRTGKTVQEEIAAIKTDITTESAQSQSGKLENRFNKDDVQKELDFQREVTEKFGPNVVEAGSLLANKFGEEAKAKRHEAAIALEEAEKAKAENNNETNRALVKQARDNFETASREAKEWETGGSQRLVIDSALNVISTALAGRPAAEVVASGLSPAVNNQIKKATTDAKGNVNTALNLTAHALWGAVEAYAGNRNVAAGAAGAAGGEVAAHFLASTLYNKSPEKLSEEEKRTVSSLSQVAAGIAGGSLSDSSDGAIIAAKTAKDAVENNYLYNGEVNSLVKELAKAEKEGKDTRPIFEKYAKLSEKNRQEILKLCGNNPACYIPHIQMMQSGDEAAYENFSYLRLGTYFNNLSRETQVKLSDFVELENGKTRNQLPKSVHYATLALGAAEAVGLGGIALTNLPKGANANEKLPIVGKTKGYENHKIKISSGAENNAKVIPLKEQLSNEVLKSRGTKLENLEVSARVEIDGKVYVDTNQRARGDRFSDPNKLTLIAENVANKKPQKNGSPYPNANMRDAHAEIGAIQQAYEKGVTKGKNMVIHVQGRDVCTHCRQDIASAAEKAGLKSVTVHAVDDKNKLRTYTWIQGQTSIKENKNGK